MEPSLSELRAILEGVPDGVVAVGLGGEVIACNRSFIDLWQIPEEVVASASKRGFVDFELAHVEDPAAFLALYEKLNERSLEKFSDVVRLRDGRVFERSVQALWLDGTFGGRVICYRDVTTKFALEQALRASEARFRRLSEAGLIGVLTGDLEGRILDANPYFLDLVGYSRADLDEGRLRWTDLTPPEFAERDEQAVRELRTRGFCAPYEKQFVRKDGARVSVVIGAALLDPEGTRAANFVLDITSRRQAEDALRLSEKRFRTVFESSPIGIAVLDLDGRVLEANPALSAMMGYTTAELCQLKPQDVTFPEDLPRELKLFDDLRAGRIDRYSMEKRYVHRDGRLIWGELVVSLGRDPDGRPLFVIGFATDITESKRAVDALRASEEKYRGLYSRTPAMMHSIDQEGRLISVSDYWLDMLGYTREEVLGHKSVEFLTPASREFAAQKVLPDFFRSGVVRNVPYQFVKKNGEVVETLLSGIMERDEHGRPVRSLAVIIDVTEQKRAEEERNHLLVKEREARVEAQKAVQLRDEFIAVASHELRTPLTPVKMQLQFIARYLAGQQFAGIPKMPELLGILKAADRELDRLSGLIEDMLVISRISAGRLVLNLSEVNLAELVAAGVERFRGEFAEAGCRVSLVLPPEIRGRFDPVLIDRVLCSLLGNAAKYGRGKPIEVSAVAEFGKAKLMVRDHGIGIEKSEQARIFERFARGVSIREYGGFGFGLYLARQIVLAHGGQIDVESEPGAGARFTVVLPLHRAAVPEEQRRG